ncbi:hypothetical protein C8R44DRAFT_707911 [Mycena epipterygia]|nr:hypothetical protein C8R44DRAFT_707911 [Mycena epipterygia]
MSSIEIQDPTFLTFVAHELEQAGIKQRPNPESFSRDSVFKRQAAILDSFAHILVAQPQNQVVAVAALLLEGPNGGLSILVAENRTPLPAVIPHLKDVFVHLRRIHSERPRTPEGQQISPEIPSFVGARADNSVFESELIELEVAILKYSWAKLHHRFVKNFRHNHFIETGNDVCGGPAEERADLDDTERALLNRLQTVVKRDLVEDIQAMVEAIERLTGILASGVSDKLVRRVRLPLHTLLEGAEIFRERSEVSHLWDLYTRARLQKQNLNVKKDPDVLRWLRKTVSLCEHCAHIANITVSPTLAHMLLQREISITAVVNPSPHRKSISLDKPTITRILATVNCKFDDKSVDDFLGRLATAHKRKLGEGKFNDDTPLATHCECHLLTKLHNRSAIPYIGVSKLSCAFCDIYFTAYRDATGIKIYTRGVQTQTAPWSFPTLLEDPILDLDIRKRVSEKLLRMITEGWNAFQRASLNPHSTAASSMNDRRRRHGNKMSTQELRKMMTEEDLSEREEEDAVESEPMSSP